MTALDRDEIHHRLSGRGRGALNHLIVTEEIDSTNRALQRLPVEQQHGYALLAGRQTAGRGRRENTWYSPPGGNIYLSLGWAFDQDIQRLSILPLAIAIAACRALTRVGLSGHGIKWPNDILIGGSKLAGILIETQAVAGGTVHAVVGIGVNVMMPRNGLHAAETARQIDRPWTDLASRVGADVSSNEVAACVLDEMIDALYAFASDGFDTFEADWQGLDLLAGQAVTVWRDGIPTRGIARGVNEDGCLLLEMPQPSLQGADGNPVRVFHAGEVSLHGD